MHAAIKNAASSVEKAATVITFSELNFPCLSFLCADRLVDRLIDEAICNNCLLPMSTQSHLKSVIVAKVLSDSIRRRIDNHLHFGNDLL
jgi:hypothetical protein